VALGVVTGDPAVSTLAGHTHRFGDMSDGHVLLTDTAHKQTAAVKRQAGVTVTHEDLR